MRILLLAAVTVTVVVSHATAVELLWNDNAGIHQVRPGDPGGPPLFQTYETRGMAVDAAVDQLFWSDILPLGSPLPGGVIRTGSTRGGEIADVTRMLTSPAGVTLDADSGKVFWTDLGDAVNPSAVFSANRDGSDFRRLISGEWLSEIAGIAVDQSGEGRLYFTYVNPLLDSLYAGGIARARLDGSNVEAVVGGLLKPVGVAIDSQGGSIFWADAGGLGMGMDGAIEAADLDGQQRRTLLGGLESPYGVALDLVEQDVYWTDMGSGKIQRTAMSGILPFFEDVVTGLDSPTAIAILSELTCDFDGDRLCNTADIDLLASAGDLTTGLPVPPADARLDLNRDGQVDTSDLDEWLAAAAADNGFGSPYLKGDADLDGAVDAADLNALALNWRQNVPLWSGGDFVANGVVDTADLNELALNWRKSIPPASAHAVSVPEPSTISLALLTVVFYSGWRRRCRAISRRAFAPGSPDCPITGR